MRTDRIGWGVAVVVAMITCKKDTSEEVSGPPPAPAAGEQAPATPSVAPTPAPAPVRDENGTRGTAVPAGTGRAAAAEPEPAPTTKPSPPAPAAPTPTPEAPPPVGSSQPPGATGSPQPPGTSGTPPSPAPQSPLPDLRLLLTAADVAGVAGGKTEFQRTTLSGVEAGQDRQSLYFEPVKGGSFGFAIQVFREGDSRAARQRWEQAFATYPNAVEVAPVAGSSFFAYWGEVLHVAFLQPHGNLVVIVSCGRKYCDSDALYALAKKANSRIK